MNVSIAINRETINEIKEDGIMPQAFYEVFEEELRKEREEGHKEGIEEGHKDVYERMIQDGMPEEKARALAFG